MIGPEVPIALWASIALASGPLLLWRSIRDFRTRRLIQNTPTARIRSMPMGLVEVNGEAVPRSDLAAPFSGRPCAYWQVDVSIRGRRDSWRVVHRNASGHPFFVRDDTAVAMVYPQGANVRLTCGVEEACSGLALPDCYAQYLKEHALGRGVLWRMDTLRFREWLIEAGDHVYVLGTATPRAQAVAISMDDALEATGTDDRRARRLQALDHDVRGVIRRGKHERTFVISQQSERDLTFQLGLRAAAEMVGGPLLTLFGLGYWADALSRWWR